MSKTVPPEVNDSGTTVDDLVREDPALLPEEKETTIRFGKDEDRATVFTPEAGLMRRLLNHPEFEVHGILLEAGGEVESVEQLHADEDAVVGVRGSVPVGALKVSARSRSTSGHASVVSRAGGGS